MIKQNILKNIAIIMDGNGRWANDKKLKRTEGHRQGAKNIRDITIFSAKHIDIESLTLYAFSTENWNRPKYEVSFLISLLEHWLQKELPIYEEFKVRFKVIGDINKFNTKLQKILRHVEDTTKNNTNLTKYLAINYGGRGEIIRAINRVVETKEKVTEESISIALDTDYTNIDILIRTGGEIRVSNFLLWQISYTELFFTKTLWPDFEIEEFKNIIDLFKKRKRRFGK